jgi:hypothetical protein
MEFTLVVRDGVCSGRAVCRYLGLGRSTYDYQRGRRASDGCD